MTNDAPDPDADGDRTPTQDPHVSTQREHHDRLVHERHQKAAAMLNLLTGEQVVRIIELDINDSDNEPVRFVAEIDRPVGEYRYPSWWTVVADGRTTYTKHPTLDGALIMATATQHHDPETAPIVAEFAARALSVPTEFF